MQYRIKMIKKNNGENVFIPQRRTDDWQFKQGMAILLSPFLFLLWLLFKPGKKLSDISYYFSTWREIEYRPSLIENQGPFAPLTSICKSKGDAETVIKNYQQEVEEESRKQEEKKMADWGNKTKKVLYIKVK